MLSALIDDHGVQFIIVGGFAVAAHGKVRGTKDVDICPDPRPKNLQRLAEALEAMDAQVLELDEFADEHDVKPDFDGLMGGGNWRLTTRYGQLDVMQYLSGLDGGYADLELHAEERKFLGHAVRFCSYEDLLKMKEAAGRPQDLVDVADLKAARKDS
jgi:Nucleotidyltransferase of unknown function (DUF6036)